VDFVVPDAHDRIEFSNEPGNAYIPGGTSISIRGGLDDLIFQDGFEAAAEAVRGRSSSGPGIARLVRSGQSA
jgi:hypothetical protein